MEMKKLLLMLIVAVMPALAHAQKEPGTFTLYPRIGVNWSTFSSDMIYTGIDGTSQQHVDSKYRAGFTAGAELQYQIGDYGAVSGGVLYSRQGTDFEDIPDDDFGKPTIKTDNIVVPLLLVGTTSFGLSAKVGLQPEFRVHASGFDEMMNKVNLSLPVGLAYEWHNIAVDVRYNFGLTRIYKDGFESSAHGRTLMITLGYGFDL